MIRLTIATLAVAALVGAGAGPAAADPVTDAGCARLVDYDTATFDPTSAEVRNPMLPLAAGSQRVFTGRSNTTGTVLPHTVTFTVTGLTKVIDGVRSVVVWDVDEVDGEVSEAELAFFAQDRAGNVWNVGEY